MKASASALVAFLLLAISSVASGANCKITTSGLSFGNYDVFNTSNTDITGSITINCTNKTSYVISLSTGSGTFAGRTMKSGTNILTYNLFLDATHLTIWGDGSAGTGTLSGTGTGANTSVTVYGRIPARQNARIGSYSDTITVTVTY